MEEQNGGRCVAIVFFQQFYLDREKDIVVDLYMEGERMHYIMRTPNHHTGNLIRNLANLFDLAATQDESGLLVIRGEVPCYFDGGNRRMYILRLGGTISCALAGQRLRTSSLTEVLNSRHPFLPYPKH